ncbi:MAG TPA: hypothetical protein V6C89_17720 [Drouetiella sp.]|jgi:hypothetical protein
MDAKHFLTWAFALGFLYNGVLAAQPAEARRMFARGANGSAGAFANQGQYGERAGARAIGYNAGAGFRGGQWAGPNGGSAQGGAAFGYKRGVGGFRGTKWQGQTANGASGSGWSKNVYNAQTGQGNRSSSEQIQTAAGKDYGYTGNTSYAKGQGGQTTIDTQNKGDYNIDWQKGQKPVVTQEP